MLAFLCTICGGGFGLYFCILKWEKGLLGSPVVKNLPYNSGDTGLIPGQGSLAAAAGS